MERLFGNWQTTLIGFLAAMLAYFVQLGPHLPTTAQGSWSQLPRIARQPSVAGANRLSQHGVAPAGYGDGAELFAGGAVLDHVPAAPHRHRCSIAARRPSRG